MCVLSQAVIESMLDQILSSLKNISGGHHFTNWKIETVNTKFVTLTRLYIHIDTYNNIVMKIHGCINSDLNCLVVIVAIDC